jgi:tetratricopeptide (TPR) repeat protein
MKLSLPHAVRGGLISAVSLLLAPGSLAFHPSTHRASAPSHASAPHATSTSLSVAAGIDIITNDGLVVGEADRSFRQGMQYERFGLFRAAAESFHEAATLYQCFLDQVDDVAHAPVAGSADEDEGSNDTDAEVDAESAAGSETLPAANAFAYVTGRDVNTCLPILAYACVRLAHLSHDALGDSKAAARLYKDAAAIDPMPSSVAFDGIGTSIEASGGSLEDAVEAYREAYRLNPSSAQAGIHLAVALERLGRIEESEPLMEQLRRSEARVSCLVDSWGYVRWHTRKEMDANLHRGTRSMLQIGLQAAMPMIRNDNGLICEFGVATGRSTRMIQEILPLGTEIHGELSSFFPPIVKQSKLMYDDLDEDATRSLASHINWAHELIICTYFSQIITQASIPSLVFRKHGAMSRQVLTRPAERFPTLRARFRGT